jgi:acylphosphatase
VTIRRKVTVSGQVQGVFFRASCQEEAQRRGVAGWVENLPDGKVGAVFEGDERDVEALIDWCRTGPDLAEVTDVQVTEQEPEGTSGFEAR